MWKEHLKSSSSRQELVPNSQSILTRCTFEEFENSRHALTQIQIGVKTELKSDRWHTHLHTHGLLVTYTVIGAQEVMHQRHFVEKKARCPEKAHGPYPRADTDPNWREDVFKRHDCHTYISYIFAECAFGADVTARIIWRPRRRTNSYSRTRPTNPDPKWLVRGPIHDPCEKLVQTPLLKSPRIIRVVQSDWLID